MTQVTSLGVATPPPPDDPDGVHPDPSERPTPAVPTRGNRVRMFVAAFVLSALAAIFCNAVLDTLQAGGDVHRLVSYELNQARFIFMLSSMVLWLVLAVMVAISGRLFVSIGVLTVLVTVLGFADYQKIRLRQEPIYPSDFTFLGQTGFLKNMVGLGPIVMIVVIAALVLLITVLLGRLLSRVYPPVRRRTEPRLWRAVLVARVVALLLAVAGLSYAAHFNDPDNRLRGAYESAGAHWAFWFQKVNYARHGFVAGFLYNMNVPAMAEPAGYGRQTMQEIADKYAAKAAHLNKGRSATALDDVNVVLVLSEAFSDPTRIKGPELAEDPTPFIRSLMGRTRSGDMLPQLFGGGTANMEFESLTGFSLSQFNAQMNTPYQMLVPRTSTFPSAVGYFRRHGHDPIAIHPYMTSMYKRYAVYPILGFSNFVHDTTMQKADLIDDNDFISDASAFDEVEYQLAKSTEPALVNLVTMQNHYPMADKYHDPIPATGVSGELRDELTNYARGLRHTDDAMRRFIGDLERSDEKTAVIFYGDHAPAFWNGPVYDANGDAAFRRTPYFIWTNFKHLGSQPDALTSPIYFLPSLFNGIGAPLPPYYALLTELQKEIPAMEQGEYHLADGRQVHEEDLSPKAKELLHDYRLVQYDLAVGHRYSQTEMFYPESG